MFDGDAQTVFNAYRTLRDEFFNGNVDAVRRDTTGDFELITPTSERQTKMP